MNCISIVVVYWIDSGDQATGIHTTRTKHQVQRYTSNIRMQLKRKNNNNSYPTNQIHLKMLIIQVGT